MDFDSAATHASPTEPEDNAGWAQKLIEVVATCGTVLVIGGPDTGKTTFARQLLAAAMEQDVSAALIDADPSQTEVGPPLSVGLSLPIKPGEPAAAAAAFVGGISAAHYTPDILTAIRRMADLAQDRRLTIVDMPGSIHGVSARRLHHLTAEMLSPAHVVAMRHGSELDSILAPIQHHSGTSVHLIQPSMDITPLPAAYRSQRLSMKLSAYFADAQPHAYAFDDIAFAGTWLGGGSPIPPHLFKYLSVALADFTRVYYAEQFGSHLGMMVSRPVPANCQALGIALEQFGAKEVTVTRAPHLKNLIVGLESDSGKLLGLGRVEAIDFKRRTIGLNTSIRAPSAVSIVKFGGIRCGEDRLSVVLPGEL